MIKEVATGRGGWVRVVPEDEPGEWMALRFEQRTKTLLEMTEVHVSTVRVLEIMPVARVTTALAAILYEPLRSAEGTPLVMLGLDFSPENGQLDEWRAGRSRPTPKVRLPKSLNLTIPGISDEPVRRPDAFYERVAQVYRSIVMKGMYNPAALIADANGVEPNRVSRWVREARNRKLLGDAPSRGKAG